MTIAMTRWVTLFTINASFGAIHLAHSCLPIIVLGNGIAQTFFFLSWCMNIVDVHRPRRKEKEPTSIRS